MVVLVPQTMGLLPWKASCIAVRTLIKYVHCALSTYMVTFVDHFTGVTAVIHWLYIAVVYSSAVSGQNKG